MKLKLLKAFTYFWDVLFTVVEYGQLYIYCKLKEKENDYIADDFHNKVNSSKKLKLEDNKTWDQVQ